MILTYSSTRSALAKWYWRSLRHNRRHLATWLVTMMLVFVLGWLWAGMAGVADGRRLLAGLIASAVTAIFLALYPQLRFKSQTRTLTLLPGGITTSMGSREETYPWADVTRVENDNGAMIITFRNLNAFIVPPDAFHGAVNARSVSAQCTQWQAEARHSTGIPGD